MKKIAIILLLTISFNFFGTFNCSASKLTEQPSFEEKIVYSLNDYSDYSIDETQNHDATDVFLTLQYSTEFTCKHTNISNDLELQEHRDELYEYYSNYNNTIMDALDLIDFQDVYLSQYGPFIVYTYDTLDDFYAHDYDMLKSRDSATLEKVYIEDHAYQDMANRNTNSAGAYDFQNALKDIGIGGAKEFDGSGIRIGSIESGIPSNYINLSGVEYETFGTTQTDHAFQTSSIYASNAGIANGASIYFAALSNHSFNECVDWLIARGVNIINRSNGTDTGQYTAASAYADYIVKETKVTFVMSAGNAGDKNSICSPSTGVNVISVASNDSNLSISHFSSAGLQDSETTKILKPTLTAPGGNITNVDNISSGLSGTSFSAPMVTGVVALLMEEYEDLKYHPETVVNLLCNTSTYISGQSEKVDYDAGYGLVNYERARNAYANVYNFVLTSVANENELIYSKDITLNIGKTINANITTLYNSSFSTTSGSPTVNSIDFSNFKIQLLDRSSNIVVAESSCESNFSYLNYTNVNSQNNLFTINVILDGSKYSSDFEYCSFNYAITTEFSAQINVGNNYLDECPTFSWSVSTESSNLNYNGFDLVFINTRGQEILRKNNITNTNGTGRYTLTRSEWADIISVYGRTYYVYIVARQPFSSTIGNYCSGLTEFTEPDDFNNKVQIKPDEWGFEPQYFFENNKEGHTSTTITDHGLTITTERLRCGYIENSYVVLSPKREDAGLAYLELTFDKPVYSYMFGIALWSNNEGLYSSTCTAVVEVMDKDGNWTVDWDLFSDLPNGFSTKSQQIDRYETAHPEGIYGIRFVMTAPATGDRNKGRLCIDDIVLNTDPDDLWFISTFYE